MSSLLEYDPIKAGCSDGSGDYIHDRAVLRAARSRYRPNKQVVGDPKKTIFVGRLNPLTKEESVKDYFSRFGSVNRCRLVKDMVTGMSRRYAFVEFNAASDACRAAERGHHAIIDSREIIVEMELERILPGWRPRRLGGGLGGNKKSGQLRFGGKETPFKRSNRSSITQTYDQRKRSRR